MKQILSSERVLFLAYLLMALVVSLQQLSLPEKYTWYTHYENYLIFKNSFPHLVQGLNPYAPYPAIVWDLFKYSPTFALAMGPFALLPDWMGLQLWNLLNALPLLWCILNIPILLHKQRCFLAWFILPELAISIQNSQSNGLTAAFFLWCWILMERNKPVGSAGFAIAGGYLKIFGIFAALPAFAYRQLRTFVPAAIVWTLVLGLLPLLLISPAQLVQVYQWWLELLQEDHSASVGLSVLGWLQTWFGWDASKIGVTVFGGLVLLSSTFAVYRQGQPGVLPPVEQRLLLWASILIWVVIFNHKAESPTFVIALTGVGLWYLSFDKPGVWTKTLLWTAFVLVSLSPSDLFPKVVRKYIFEAYVLKAVPCILIWTLISIRLLRPLLQKQVSSSHE